MTALVAIETVALALLALLVAGLLRSHAEILRALHDLGVGIGDPSAPDTPASLPPRPTPAPTRSPGAWAADISGRTPAGDVVALAVAGARYVARLSSLLLPADDALLQLHPVSSAVNSVRNNGPELVRPV
jgi:hypothetical protein